ncbi:hypothetical protein JCM8547_000474 [Rhodosporidiobolus lusitaniae]
MAPLPAAPSPSAKLSNIHYFIPSSRLVTLLPFDGSAHEMDRGEQRRALAFQHPPVWTVELELYYRMFIADAWVMVEKDDEADRLYVLEMDKLLTEKLPQAEQGPARATQVRTLMEAAELRRVERRVKLLALHSTRSVCLST